MHKAIILNVNWSDDGGVMLEPYWNFPKSCLKINKASGAWGRMNLRLWTLPGS